MSEKTSRKHFLVATGTVVAGVLASLGLRRGVEPASVVSTDKMPVEARPDRRAVPARRA